MPRKSAEALWAENYLREKAPPPPPHPEPPSWMPEGMAAHWRAIVRDKDPEYFDAAAQYLLQSLCGALYVADITAREMHKLDPRDPRQFRQYARWTIISSRESKLIAQLMTKLKLLPRGTPETRASSVNGGARPWDKHV